MPYIAARSRAARSLVAAVVLTVVGAACGSSGNGTADSTNATTGATHPTATSSPTTATPTTPATTSAPTTNPNAPATCATGSSPSTYDPQQGKYAVYIAKIESTAHTIDFDPIQFLVGDDATKAWHRDHPGEVDGPPNDYYIVNANPRVYHASIAANVVVWQVRLEETGSADLKSGTFASLVTYLAAHKPASGHFLALNPYWVTIANSEVTTICEQYVP